MGEHSKSSKMENTVHYQPALGVKSDFEQLIQRFTDTETVRYERFAEIWREMKLSLYCAGRDTHREVREFVEECFKIAVHFLLPPSSFQVRAGAVYLLYGLYNFQLCRPKIKIRMTPEAWKSIMEFQELAHQQQHLDIDYILHNMQVVKAFQFVYHPVELYPTQKEIRDTTLPETFKDEGNLLDEVFSSHTLNQISMIHDQYHKMKLAVSGTDVTVPDSSLNIIHPELVQTIYSSISGHKQRINNYRSQNVKGKTARDDSLEDPGNPNDPPYRPSKKTSLKGKLKQKAYETFSQKGRSRRQLPDISSEEQQSPSPKKRGRRKAVLYNEEEAVDETDTKEEMNDGMIYSMPSFEEPSASASRSHEEDTPVTAMRVGRRPTGKPKVEEKKNKETGKKKKQSKNDLNVTHTDSKKSGDGEMSAQKKLQEKLKNRRKTARKSAKKR